MPKGESMQQGASRSTTLLAMAGATILIVAAGSAYGYAGAPPLSVTLSLSVLLLGAAYLRQWGRSQDLLRAQEVLEEERANCHGLFSEMSECVALYAIHSDAFGEPVEFRILNCNPAFAAMLGVPKEHVLGTQVSTITAFKQAAYLDVFTLVAETGLPSSFQTQDTRTGREYSVSVTPVGIDRFATVAKDITALNRVQEQLRSSEAKFRSLVENSQDIITRYGHDRKLLYASPALHRYFPLFPVNVTGKSHGDLGKPCSLCGKCDQIVEETLRSGDSYMHLCDTVVNGQRLVLDCRFLPESDEQGNVVSILGLRKDVTRQKRMEEAVYSALLEKDALIKEVHHRVGNNLQVISSLIDLQCESLEEGPALNVLRRANDRVHAMALIHEKLYISADLSRVCMDEYIPQLIRHVAGVHDPEGLVELRVAVENVELTIDKAVPCGLLAGELAVNALQHAFEPGTGGTLDVCLARDGDQAVLNVRDSGRGMPEGYRLENAQSLGMQIVVALAGQLGGSLECAGGEGASFRVAFAPEGAQAV